jgi:hypothetical protein
LHVELFASVNVSVLPDTSVIWQVTSRDLGAHTAYATRTVTLRTERSTTLKAMDSLILGTVRYLREQDFAPRRKPVSPDSPSR